MIPQRHYLKNYALCRSISIPWVIILEPREHLGRPWEHQDGHEGVQNRRYIDFELFVGPYFESCLCTEAGNFVFLFGLVSRPLFVPIFESKFGRLGLLKQGFRIESFAKVNFSLKSLLIDFGIEICRFLLSLGTFADFCWKQIFKLMDFQGGLGSRIYGLAGLNHVQF